MKVRLGIRTVDGTSGAAAWEIRTGATPGRAKLIEIGFTLAAATASTIGFGWPAAIGTTPTAPVNFLPVDPNDVIASGVVQSALAWAVGPTIPTAFLARVALPATIGTGVVWEFPEADSRAIVIPVSSSIILWNLAANSVLDAWACLEI